MGADRSGADQPLRWRKEQLGKVFATSPDAINVNRLLGEVRG